MQTTIFDIHNILSDKKLSREQKTYYINFSVDEHLYKKYKDYTDKHNIGKSELFRTLLKYYLSKVEEVLYVNKQSDWFLEGYTQAKQQWWISGCSSDYVSF